MPTKIHMKRKAQILIIQKSISRESERIRRTLKISDIESTGESFINLDIFMRSGN